MSSTYIDFVKSLNPAYCWTFDRVRWPPTGAANCMMYPPGSYSSPYYAWSYQNVHDEYQRKSNEDATTDATATEAATSTASCYHYSYMSVLGEDNKWIKHNRSAGPITGGASLCTENWNTAELGPAFMHSGDDGWTRDHLVPIGRDHNCTWNMWVKCAEELTTGTRHYLTSGVSSGTAHQHLMFGENYGGGQRKVKIKFKHTHADLSAYNENSLIDYDWDATKWNMWTVTMPMTDLGETITDGVKAYLNGRLAVSADAVGDAMPPSGEQPISSAAMQIWGMRAYSSTPGGTIGSMSQVAAWDRVLNESEISDLFYHATSPSPMRVRGGLNRSLGRLV